MIHVCKELQYVEKRIEDLRRAASGHGDSLLEHCLDVGKIFDRLFRFYGFQDDTLLELGHYLSYYHDVGKLEGWVPGRGHSMQSVKLLNRDCVKFKSCGQLTHLAWYLISRHHSSLTPPSKVDWRGLKVMEELDWRRYPDYLQKEIGVELVNVADVFGLFKLADAISAYKAKTGEMPCFDTKPTIHVDHVRCMLGGDVDEDRWGLQLRLCELSKIAMLRAPTGWGKTSSSLLFASTRGPTRVFYLLPTITAIREFFGKLHRVFPEAVSMYFHLYDAELKDESEERLQQIFFVKSFLSPIVVTTVDQFLLAFFQLGKYFVKRPSFRGASIILDEVHLLSPQALHLLTYFLGRFREKYGLSVLIMSATLPDAYVRYLQGRLGLNKGSMLDLRQEYSKKRRVLFNIRENDIASAVQEMYDSYVAGNRVLVVTNTVEKAVSITKHLRKLLHENRRSPDDVLLIHGRFMYRDRRRVEEAIEKMRGKPHMLVSTQVCEVSLDVSYDRLYTEAAPLGSVVQRFGRVNRYGVRTDSVNALVFYPNELRDTERAERYPYEEGEVRLCWDVLKELEGERLGSELKLLDRFDKVFDVNDLESSTSRCKMDVWEDVLCSLFSVSYEEDFVRRCLEYRESFTILSLIHPDCIRDMARRNELHQAIEQAKNSEGYVERLRAAATLKDLAVPVPFWYLKEVRETIFGLPVIELKKGEYSVEYGLH